nr:SIMPL domain-containing protein [uncultured Flavobacterium sp.]
MKKHFTILAFVLLTLNSFSQNISGNTITAEGSSKTKVKPDLAGFSITVQKRNLVEKISIKELNEEIEKLQNLLLKIGFTEKNIKISEYKVSNFENNNDKKEYTTTNTLIVEFNLDYKLIEAFYQEIQNENLKDADIEFETQVSENLEKLTRQKLVKSAIEDAKNNAENIANALEVKLVNVKQVSKYTMRDFDSAPMMKVSEVKLIKPRFASEQFQKTSFDKFEVNEKEFEETITIIYEITKK